MEITKNNRIKLMDRFQVGTVEHIDGDEGILHLKLTDKCHWAKWARIQLESLPKDKKLSDYPRGKLVKVFLFKRTKYDANLFRASISWADHNTNPWSNNPPEVGGLNEAIAVAYLPNMSGVVVRLQNNIEALLRVNNVPGNNKDISDIIDIGDSVIVEIINVDEYSLGVEVSINAALKTLQIEENRKRLNEFELGTVQMTPIAHPETSSEPKPKLALLIDPYFSQDLSTWLNAFNIDTLHIKDSEHFIRILSAPNLPTHLLCNPKKWPINNLKNKRIEKLLLLHNIQLIWLKNENEVDFKAPSLEALELTLPIHLFSLIQLLTDGKYQLEQKQQKQHFDLDDYQHHHVIHLANCLLEKICTEHSFQAALWVKRDREGVYLPHAWYNLDENIISSIKSQLAQTLFSNSIKQNTFITRGVSQLGALERLTPSDSDHAICMPIEHNGAITNRAVVFFYNQKNHNQASLEKVLRQFLPTMQALIDTLHFAEHNETLTAFSRLGLNSASYLHELGQAATPIHDFLRQHSTPQDISNQDWNALKKNIQRLLDMAHTDLSNVQREKKSRLRLKQRLERVAEIYLYRFNRTACAFKLSLPDLPMMLSINPLIIEQVVCNLLDNALYFVENLGDAGRVTINVKLNPETPQLPIIIDVIDNGSGVRASMRQRIFQPRDSGKAEGTGMGLFISQHHLKSIGGKLELLPDSVRWQRTCFRIHLPLVLNSAQLEDT